MTGPEPVLRCEALAVGYRGRRRGRAPARTVLAGVELTLPAGTLACLLGPNGAGKSTLLRTLTGGQPPLAGHVRIEGRPLHDLPVRARSRVIGVVLADRVEAAGLSAYQVVALGRHPHTTWAGRLDGEDHDQVWAAMAATGTAGFAARPLDELSDGERQRVLIARALAQQPRLLVLDEPTAFLDVTARLQLLLLLRDLARRAGIAVVVSTHDLDLALRLADVTWLATRTGAVHAAPPEELLRRGTLGPVFGVDGLAFDASTGTLAVRPPPTHAARLAGAGPDAVLARRALERLGFRVHETGTAPALVDLAVAVRVDGWHATDRHGTTRHPSLAALADHARRLTDGDGA